MIPWWFPTEDYTVSFSELSRKPLSCYLDETHITHDRRAYTKDDEGETEKGESIKVEVLIAKDLTHQVASSQSYVDVAVNMGMFIPEEALKEAATKELAQAEDHHVWDNIISHDDIGFDSDANEAADEGIFISDNKDEIFAGKVDSEDL